MADVGRHRNDDRATPDGDWPSQAADSIERVVGSVRDKTTGPALTISRGVVYGTFAAIVGMATLVLAVIMVVRLLDNYLPDAVFGETHTWAAHLTLGLVCTIGGLYLWSRRSSRGEETGAT